MVLAGAALAEAVLVVRAAMGHTARSRSPLTLLAGAFRRIALQVLVGL